jgi:WG containing repeat
MIDGRWGYVDGSGQISIRPQFQWAQSFSEGLVAVGLDGRTGFIDHSGRLVIAPRFEMAEGFSDGRALISRMVSPEMWAYGFIDRSGNPAFPGEYIAATSFYDGLAHVQKERGRYIWIDTSGRAVFTHDAPSRP